MPKTKQKAYARQAYNEMKVERDVTKKLFGGLPFNTPSPKQITKYRKSRERAAFGDGVIDRTKD